MFSVVFNAILCFQSLGMVEKTNTCKRRKLDLEFEMDASNNCYMTIMEDVGLCKNAAEIVLQHAGIEFCPKHATYYPSTLASCCLCFNLTISDFTTPAKLLMYDFLDDNQLFYNHLIHFDNKFNPIVRKLGYSPWFSHIFIGNIKRDMDMISTPIVLFTHQPEICKNWRNYNIKPLFLDEDHNFVDTGPMNDARKLLAYTANKIK